MCSRQLSSTNDDTPNVIVQFLTTNVFHENGEEFEKRQDQCDVGNGPDILQLMKIQYSGHQHSVL